MKRSPKIRAIEDCEPTRAIFDIPDDAIRTAVIITQEGYENLQKLVGKTLVAKMENGVLVLKPEEDDLPNI